MAKKVDSGDWKWFFYDGLQVVAEGTGTSDRTFYTESGAAVGGIIARDDDGTKYWYHYDRLGNVMAVTDSSGNAYAVYTQEAFGSVLEKGTSTGYASEHGTDPQLYHLLTKEYDSDVDLYYFYARWYDPATGRFVSRAPGFLHFEHPYSYSEGKPTAFVDPTGKTPFAACLGVTIGCSLVMAGLTILCKVECPKKLVERWVQGRTKRVRVLVQGDEIDFDAFKDCIKHSLNHDIYKYVCGTLSPVAIACLVQKAYDRFTKPLVPPTKPLPAPPPDANKWYWGYR